MTHEPEIATEHRRLRWERATDLPLTTAAVAFLVAYAWPILDPAVSDNPVFGLVVGVSWLLFVVDYVVRLGLSQPPRRRSATYALLRRKSPNCAHCSLRLQPP